MILRLEGNCLYDFVPLEGNRDEFVVKNLEGNGRKFLKIFSFSYGIMKFDD